MSVVENLKEIATRHKSGLAYCPPVLLEEAADEIERLRAENDKMRRVLDEIRDVDIRLAEHAIDTALNKALRESSTLVAKGRLIDAEGK